MADIGTTTESEAREIWRSLLHKYLGASAQSTSVRNFPPVDAWDDVVEFADVGFVVQYKVRSDTASISATLEQMLPCRKNLPEGLYPLLVVRLMGATGSALCAREGIDWLDLAGNAHITHVPRMRIIVEGKKAASRAPGRKSNVFATKSSRLAHWLLLHQGQPHTHQQLVEATGIDKGHLSRLLSRMEELRLIRRDNERIVLAKPSTMVDAWSEAYQHPCESVLKGVIPARSGPETVEIIEEGLRSAKRKYVIGGLASAWAWSSFADFRIATFYLDGAASPQLLSKIGFVETDRGANVWFMQEADDVAFLGSERRKSNHVASPWFTYVDLSIHPERSKEASERLREQTLKLESPHGT